MSDAELAQLVLQRIDALYLAHVNFAAADEAMLRNVDEVHRARREVDCRRTPPKPWLAIPPSR